MGGCTSSKYAADEDKTTEKKEKKSNGLLKLKVGKKDKAAANGKVESGGDKKEEDNKQKSAENKEDISFIDDERKEDEDQKKEVTTYQTTVVKHTQKEGNELLAHLKEEAFRTLQNALKSGSSNSAVTVLSQTTNASVTDNNNTTTSSSSTSSPDDDLLKQVTDQVVAAIGKNKEEQILAIIQSGSDLIKENKVNSMSELEAELEKLYPSSDEEKTAASTSGSPNSGLVSRIINATTGFLTAKGTEAGAMLSTILANANAGLTGVLNETEKTTVKVTRTVTEQIITTNGQIKEITKTITSNEPLEPGQNIQDIIKNLATGGTTRTTTGTTSSTANTQVTEKHEPAAEELADQAEKVVNHVVTTAVEKVIDEQQHQQQNGHHHEDDAAVPNGAHNQDEPVVETTENVKIEEESSVKVSTTKIVLNGDGSVETTVNGKLEQVQGEFYQNGKHDAEEAVKKTVVNSDDEASAPVANES